jgi:di/tripeptidase
MIPSMISSGPTTENAPSPAERLHVPSLAKIGEFPGGAAAVLSGKMRTV